MDWETQFDSELAKAEQARSRGNEGQARVCARRAAGLVAREHLRRQGIQVASRSVLDLLNLLARDPRLKTPLRTTVHHLTLRVDSDFKLPPDLDLVTEARLLREGLLGQ